MSLIHEQFDGGLVTARDPATLRAGEVQRAINCIYRPSSPGLWKAPGRSAIHSAALSASAKGLRYLRFDTGTSAIEVVVAHISAEYQVSSTLAESGVTFSSLVSSIGTGSTLESVHYNNKHFLFNGNTEGIPNYVAKISESAGTVTTRQHGLTEVKQVPTLALATGEGWPNTTDFGTGYYFFFYTEVVNPGGPDEIESALGLDIVPKSISIANFADGVTVTMTSSKDNSTATHRRIYIVGPKQSSVWNPFYLVEARVLGTFDIAQTSIIFGLNATSTTKEEKAANSSAGSVGWNNPNNIFTARDGNLADADFQGRRLVAGFATFTGGTAIQGIEVLVSNIAFGSVGTAIVELSWDGGTSWTSPVNLDIGTIGGGFPLLRASLVGGRNYRWGRTWATSELTAANFRARVTTQGQQTGTLKIDYVQANVYSGASTGTEPIKLGYYPTTSVKIGPTVTVLSSNTPPPVASTGDIFEAQLVLNDVRKRATLRWSRVDEPDYFPVIYTLTLPSPDKITVIRRINNVLIVGMEQHIWRVNYLPTSVDNSFETGQCYEPLAEDHGIIGTQAYAFFAPDGMAAQLAYVSASGLRYTNGLTTNTLTEDIDWPNTVNITKLDKCILVNDPNLASLIFYYIPAGDNSSTSPTRALYLSYHSSKIKDEGKLAVAGPVTVDAASSTIGFINKLPVHLTGSSAGSVSVEDRGEGSQEIDIITRDIYPDAIGSSMRARAHWLRYAASDPGVTVIVTPYVKNSGKDYDSPALNGQWSRKTFRNNTVSRIPGDSISPRHTGGLARLAGDFSAESFALRIQSEQVIGQAVGGVAISAYGFDAKSQGEKEI